MKPEISKRTDDGSLYAKVVDHGQGRDATDVPMTHTFGPNTLVSFKVWTDEVS